MHDGAIAWRAWSSETCWSRSSRRAGMGWTPTRSITAPICRRPTITTRSTGGFATGGGPTRSFISASTARSSGCPAREWGSRPNVFLTAFSRTCRFVIRLSSTIPARGAGQRRAHAVVIDHLVPPMTTADAYGPLAELTQLVDEYYQVERLDPSKLPILQQQIWELIRDAHLDEDLKQVMTARARAYPRMGRRGHCGRHAACSGVHAGKRGRSRPRGARRLFV